MVLPPERMMFLVRSFLISMSEFWTDCQARAYMDLHVFPLRDGLNMSSGQVMRTVPGIVITLLSGRVYDLSCSADLFA